MSTDNESKPSESGGLTWIELFAALALIGVLAALMLPNPHRPRKAARRASCASNLKQMALSLKMYSEESNGQMYPAIQFTKYQKPNLATMHADNLSMKNLLLDFFPRVASTFPEYMPDPRGWICPSDSSNRLSHLENIDCVALSKRFDCEGGRESDTCPTGFCGAMDYVSDSYTYFGWAFDKPDVTQDLGAALHPKAKTSVPDFLDQFSSSPNTHLNAVKVSSQITQVFEIFLSEWLYKCAVIAGPDNAQCIAEALDQDFDDVWVDGIVDGTPLGNGKTNTVYRLREGVERFLITDINKAGAAARAQSEIFVMWDNVATDATGFHHAPGGSNVLYLDGHVSFINFPGPQDSPVHKGVAEFVKAFGAK